MRRRTSMGSLGVTPATDTTPPATVRETVNTPVTVAVISIVVVGIGVLLYFNEKDD